MRKRRHLRPQKTASRRICRLFGRPESRVGFQGDKGKDFQHPGFEDGQAFAGLPHLGFAGSLPEDSGARRVAPAPDLAENAGDVKLFDALALLGDEFRGKGFGGERIGAASRNGEKLHISILKEVRKDGRGCQAALVSRSAVSRRKSINIFPRQITIMPKARMKKMPAVCCVVRMVSK